MKSFNKLVLVKTVFLLSLSLCLNTNAFAITISSENGAITHKNSVTIQGLGFGQKSPAAPYFFDNFESGTAGSTIVGKSGTVGSSVWQEYAGYGMPNYVNSQHYGQGSLSAGVTVPGNSFMNAAINGINSRTVYFSMRYRWNASGTNWESAVYKPIRLTAPGDFYSPDPKFITQYQPSYNWAYELMTTGGGDGPQMSIVAPSQDTWHRAEVYISLSNPAGTANGITQSWHDFQLQYNQTNFVNLASSSINTTIDSFLLPFDVANNSAQTWNMWADDVYFDITRARVEIGNNQNFNLCTNREIQIPSAWTDSSITFTVNQGNFNIGDNVYIFVVDSNGNASTGFGPIAIGGSASNSPLPPTNLHVTVQ